MCSCGVSMQYGVVIDAGSSHTSFYLYEWYLPDPNNATSTGVVFETSVCPNNGERYIYSTTVYTQLMQANHF